MKYRGALFDLDGTLLNTLEDLGRSMNSVLNRMGLPVHAIPEYRYFVGEGITMLAQRALPASRRDDATVIACVAAMSEEYGAHCSVATMPYPGVTELLECITALKIKTAVLSNKPDEMTKSLVKRYFPSISFTSVFGAREDVPRKPHPAGALETAGLLALEPAAMIYLGDSKTDMETATAAGMHPVGALWGFRDETELRQSGAKLVISHPRELLDLFGN
jgi:phosphoglycolate phosphatase